MIDGLTLTHYRHFLLVAELRSYRLAAARAFRTQPALSMSIRDMEQRLGQPLFEPGNRTALTPFGEQCLPLVRELLEQHERVAKSMQGLARSEGGILAMACVSSAATHWLPELVSRFRQRHPQVELRLFDEGSANVERMVLAGEVELGICSPVLRNARLHFTPVHRDAFGLVCHRDHPLAARRSLRWSEIRELQLISTVAHRQLTGHSEAAFMYEEGQRAGVEGPVPPPGRPKAERALSGGSAAGKRGGPPFFVGNMMSLLSLVSRGVGATVLARLGVPPDRPEIVFVPLTHPRLERTLGIMQLAGRTLSPPAAAMAALVQSVAREQVKAE